MKYEPSSFYTYMTKLMNILIQFVYVCSLLKVLIIGALLLFQEFQEFLEFLELIVIFLNFFTESFILYL
jgi:hypothetical protein